MPSGSPSASARPSAAPIAYARPARVDLRYAPWAGLAPAARSHAAALGYDAASWEAAGTNPVEFLDWRRLTREQVHAARGLGYDQPAWDCWQNHFQAYRWIDLGLPQLRAGQWWEALGWDIYAWNRYADPPPSDGRGWYALTPPEREAAAHLCYLPATWDEGDGLRVDGFPLQRPGFRYRPWTDLDAADRRAADGLKYAALTWNVPGLAPAEGRAWAALTDHERARAADLGFAPLAWDCWQNHFRGYGWDELTFYGLDMPYAALGWTARAWDGAAAAPPSHGGAWEDLTPAERGAAAELCYFRDNWDGLDMTPNNGPFRFPKVKGRYVQWDEQPGPARRAARHALHYNRTTWDLPGRAQIEGRRWADLTAAQRDAALTVGFYHRTWDCFQNHYRAYAWDDLDADSRNAATALGWDAAGWDDRDADLPPVYGTAWDALRDEARDAATLLCFFEDTWDGNTLVRDVPAGADAGESVGVRADAGGGTDVGDEAPAPDVRTTSAPGAEGEGYDADGFSVSSVSVMAAPASSANRVAEVTMTCLLPAFGTLVPFVFAL